MDEHSIPWNVTWLLSLLNTTRKRLSTIERPELFKIPIPITFLLFVAYGTICVLALIGNSLVLWLVLPVKRMWSVTNLPLVNLAVADIIISIFTIPFQFQAALLQRWDLPRFLCPICPFVQALSVLVSVFTVSAMALLRYKAVIYPFERRASKKTIFLSIAFIWIVSFMIAFPTYMDYAVVSHRLLFGRKLTTQCLRIYLSKQIRWHYSLGLILTQYFIPLIIITGAYVRMGLLLCRTEFPVNQNTLQDANFERKKKRAAKVMSGVVLMFALCWFPYQTYQVMIIFYPGLNDFHYINIIWFGMHWLAMSNSCCNPFIYAIYNDKFQAELKIRMSSGFCGKQNNRRENARNVFEMNNRRAQREN